MSALPSPRPQARKKSRKQLLKAFARLLEDQMDDLGLSEAEKNARVTAFSDDVKRLKASRRAVPSK
jgi:hypothetical protein